MRRKWNSKVLACLLALIMIANVCSRTGTIYAVETDDQQVENTTDQTADDQRSGDTQAEPEKTLACPLEIHQHEQSCYDEDGNLICGLADFVVHEHDENCYDSNGALVCTLPEIKEHVHESSCFKQGETHTHGEACYQTNRVLTCDQEESTGHTHSDSCYQMELICGQNESAAHTHSDNCYQTYTELICGQEEYAGHTHSDSCRNEAGEVICGQEESTGHTHSDSCYQTKTELTCGQEETAGHSHADSCYQRNLTCGQEESTGHTHTDSCCIEEKVLTCQETENGQILICEKKEAELHTHQPSCYDENGNRICGKLEVEQHQHTDECFEEVEASDAEDGETAESEEDEAEEALSLDPEIIQSLSQAIVEAASADTDVWNQVLMAMYSEEEEYCNELAEQFAVEPETMQLYLQYMGESFHILYNAMDEDEDGTFWEELLNAPHDQELLDELAERFGIHTEMLLLFIHYSMANNGTMLLANTGDTYSAGYNLDIDGTTYVAFSLNKTKTQSDGVSYTQQKTVSGTWNDWLVGKCQKVYSSRYWLINAVSLCATYYNSSSWLQTTISLTGCAESEAKGILRQAVQQAIWFYTDYSGSEMSRTTGFGELSYKIKDTAYWASGSMPSDFPFNWYVPSSDSAPYLLVATGGGYSTSSYVGIKAHINIGTSNTTSGLACPELYVIPQSAYENGTSTTRQADSSVAYCFNKSKTNPYNDWSGVWYNGYYNQVSYGRCLFTKIENADGETFATIATNERLTGDDLRTMILSIGLNGYPLNFSKFNTDEDGNQRISDTAFRVLTQYAIWYYTDSYNMNTSGLTATEKEILYKLLNTKLPESITNQATSNVHLYQTQGAAYTGDTNNYQNLLSVDTTASTLPTEPDGPVTLTLAKTISGNFSDTEFEFTIKLTNRYGTAITGKQTVTSDTVDTSATAPKISSLTFSADGTAIVKLKAGQSITIQGLPYGFNYSIVETSSTAYTTEITAPYGATVSNKNQTVSQSFVAENISVTYHNISTEPGKLVVSKTVTSTLVNIPDATFTFEAVFTGEDAAPYTAQISWTKGTEKGSLTPDSDGMVSFTLKKDETITMELPAGVSYEISEVDIPTGFSLTDLNSGATGKIVAGTDSEVTFNNNYSDSVTTVNINGVKTWVGDEDTGKRPSSITLQLWKHLEGTDETTDKIVVRGSFNGSFTTNASLKWAYKFSSMPKYENGRLITYYVKEPNVPDGYVSKVNGMNVTNTYVPNTYSLTLSKVIYGRSDLIDASQQFEFEIALKNKAGDPMSGTFDVTASELVDGLTQNGETYSITFTEGVAKVKLKHGQSITINGLTEKYSYTIKETNADGYATTILAEDEEEDDTEERILEGVEVSSVKPVEWNVDIRFINKKNSLTLSKMVTGEYASTSQPFTFEITLQDEEGKPLTGTYDVIPSSIEGVNAPDYSSVEFDENGQTLVSLIHGQSVTLHGLPDGYSYTIQELEEDSDELMFYEAKNQTVVDGVEGHIVEGSTVSGSQSGADIQVNYTNERMPQTFYLGLSKTVSGQFADKTKEFAFDIYLWDKDGNAVSGTYAVETSAIEGVTAPVITDNKVTFTAGKATVSLKHGQSLKILGIPEKYKYQIVEQLGEKSVYTTKIVVQYNNDANSNEETLANKTSGDTGKRELDKNETVEYTNVREDISPTGIHMDLIPLALGSFLAVLLTGIAAASYLMRKKRRNL
jgi:TQXA domain-containing protein